MKTNRLYIVAALLGTVLAGCQKTEELKPEEKPEAPKTAKLTVQAKKGDDTKALSLDGNDLSATWAVGETVNVFLAGEPIGSLEVMSVNAGLATLEGDITTTGMAAEQQYALTLLFPGRSDNQWTYLGQDGISPSESNATLADRFDYAKATLEITFTGSAITVPEGTVVFGNQQNIYRFSFDMPVTSFTVSASSNQLIQSLSYSGDNWTSTPGSITVDTYVPNANAEGRYEYFVSLRNESTSADTYYFSYVDEDNESPTYGALFEGVKAIKAAALNDGYGKFLGAKVNLAQKAFTPASGTIDTVSDVL